MFATDTYSPFETGLSNAKTVVSLEWLYESVKNHFGRMFFVVLVVVIGLPFVFFFGYWLNVKRKRFQRVMKKNLPVFKSSNDYVEFKTNLKKLEELLPTLKKVSSRDLKKSPLPLKYTLYQMQKMTSTLFTYSEWLRNRLNCLNEEQFKSDTTLFKFVSEKDLWQNRNNAYQYWM